jgi:hypothetical protein
VIVSDLVDFARRVVSVAAVRSLELAAVDGHHVTQQQLPSATHFDETTAYVTNGWPIVAAEIGYRLEIGNQTSHQPHHLGVALEFALKAPARWYPVQIPIDVDPKQHTGMVGRASGNCGSRAIETEIVKV